MIKMPIRNDEEENMYMQLHDKHEQHTHTFLSQFL